MKKGKRYLVIDKSEISWTLHREKGDLMEIKVLEISPKGRVKLRLPSGFEFWEQPSNYHIVEELEK